MNFQLTAKEKKIKQAEARRRAILWFEREIRKKQLNQAQARVGTISISESPASASAVPRQSELTTLNTVKNCYQTKS